MAQEGKLTLKKKICKTLKEINCCHALAQLRL